MKHRAKTAKYIPAEVIGVFGMGGGLWMVWAIWNGGGGPILDV